MNWRRHLHSSKQSFISHCGGGSKFLERVRLATVLLEKRKHPSYDVALAKFNLFKGCLYITLFPLQGSPMTGGQIYKTRRVVMLLRIQTTGCTCYWLLTPCARFFLSEVTYVKVMPPPIYCVQQVVLQTLHSCWSRVLNSSST